MSSKSKKRASRQNNPEVTQEIDTNMESENIEPRETQSMPVKINEKMNTPLRTQRSDEKNMLIAFNNRLAAVIEKNRHLEHMNNTLRSEVHRAEEDLTLTKIRLESTFSKEVDDTRKKLQESNKENASVKLSESQAKTDLETLQKKFDKKEKDVKEMTEKLTEMDEKTTRLQSDLFTSNTKNANLTKYSTDLENDKASLAAELNELRQKFEEESLANVDLQEQLRGKIEDSNIKASIYEQEIIQVKSSRALEIEEVDGKLQQEYADKLQEALKLLRKEYEKELEKNKKMQENLYNKNEADLGAQINSLSETVSSKVYELEIVQAKLDDVFTKMAAVEGEKHGLVIQVQELEKKMKEDREKFNQEKNKKDDENEQLRKHKNDLIADYKDLLDTKTGLDNELTTYRILLESEELRLDLCPESMKTDSNKNLIQK